ncbi:MAG: hypothetical protein ACRD45_02630 [Bryobacteraceae bacterium]
MATTVIPIHGIERRMRGGSQSLLVRDQAGNAYIAKCVGNPQGTRTLINEWIVSRLLKHLRVSTPDIGALRIERGTPGEHLLEFQVGNRKIPIAPGLHLGSACPADPDRRAIFDFLPRRLLHRVVNLPDLFLSFTFDKWVNQTDSRQTIFIRERGAGGVQFRTYMIDHGLSFGGSRWEVSDSPLNGLFYDRSVYDHPAFEAECHAAVARIQDLPESSFSSVKEEIPPEWLAPGDREEMTRLLELLCGRRRNLHGIVDRTLRQLHEAGIVPKAAESKVLLGSLLLLVCLTRSLPPASAGTGAPAAPMKTVRVRSGARLCPVRLATSSDFGLGRRYAIQVWRAGRQTARPDAYLFRIYDKCPGPMQGRLVGEYGVLNE